MSIPMSESVLAAIIAGTATLSASLLQLRSALLREAARGQSASRRKNRVQTILLLIVVGAAAVAGFALSQWLTSGERLAQRTLQQELQARVAEISRTASQLELTRAGARAEIENAVLRQIGADGVVVAATVAACRPALVINAPGTASPPGASAEAGRSEEHTSELQSRNDISYAVFCLKKKKTKKQKQQIHYTIKTKKKKK